MPDPTIRPTIFTVQTKDKITLYLGGAGVTAYAELNEEEARRLIRRLQADVDAMPREASAADLGIAA